MTKAKKTELEHCLTNALATLEAHTRGLTQDLDSETGNLHSLVSNQDKETQSHLSQLDSLIGNLRKDLASLQSDLTQARTIASEMPEEGTETVEEKEPSASEDTHEPSLSAKEASEIRHDEPVTLATVIRSLLMADEPGQRERRNSL